MIETAAKNSSYGRFFKRILLLGLLIFAIANSWSDTDKNHTLREHWNNSDLKFDELIRLSATCHKGPLEFKGCLRAAETILRFFKLPLYVKLKTAKPLAISLAAGDSVEHSATELERSNFFSAGFVDPQNMSDFFSNLRSLVIPSPDESLVTGLALNAYLNEIDPHAGLLPRDYIKELERTPNLKEAAIGIGINFRRAQDICIVTSVLQESAAQLAGVQAGDQMIRVGQESCSKLTSFQISEHLQETVMAGTPVQLELRRNKRAIALTLTPGILATNTVETKIAQNIATIRVLNFYQGNTCQLVEKALEKSKTAGSKAIILDLRNNPGGYIEDIACIAGLFLGQNVALANFTKLSSPDPNPIGESLYAGKLQGISTFQKANFALLSSHEQVTSLPLCVLINHATASSSEILAGALQEYARAWILGSTSFGKGTMQTTAPLKYLPKIQLTQTTHRIRLPSGRELQRLGVRPQFMLQGPPETGPREADLFSQALKPLEPPPEFVQSPLEQKIRRCIYRENIKEFPANLEQLAKAIFACQSNPIT